MKIVITGATGQLGHELVQALSGNDLAAFGRLELDVCDFVYTRRTIAKIRPEVVINAAALTRVDDCETEPERAFWVNTYAVRNLAQVCADLDCTLVHVSTDYVFDGRKASPYSEDDAPNPLSVYGISKLAGEFFVRSLVRRYYVIRTSGLYGVAGAGTRRGNFVEKIVRAAERGQPIRVVDDQVLAPTAAVDVARKIGELLSCDDYGVYHITDAGQCSWFEFAKTALALCGITASIEPISSAEFSARARRPSYSVLARSRLAQIGADDLPPWQEALSGYLRQRARLRVSRPQG
ncbi:MAG: dTDP-4-dehydrorhamnose reductase [Armatimonadetes bacterium]|nr:dTDP-4-dehydrorhamnose reductase [Armatimonadota bacterium]MBM3746390.1 dTDP-4-dehydrorhamnose reductase [Acidobacteriota bacterium]